MWEDIQTGLGILGMILGGAVLVGICVTIIFMIPIATIRLVGWG